jgi:hypothetical protein
VRPPSVAAGEAQLRDLAQRFDRAERQVIGHLAAATDGGRTAALKQALSIITALRLLDARTPVALAYLTAHPDGRPDGVRDLAGSLAKRLDAGAQVAAESAQTAFARVTRDNLDEMAVAAVGAAVDARSIRWSLGRWATMQTQTIGRQATSRGVSDRVGEGGQVTIHTGECSWCAEHAGVAVIGQDPLPPFHPNCSCVATAA